MTNVLATKQAAKEEYWYRGNLSYKLHSSQKQLSLAFNSIKTPLFVGNCSRQNGKSYWAVTKAIEVALKIKKAQIRYGAAFQSDLVDFIIPAFEKVMEDAPKALKGKYKVQGSKFVFPNGSTIKLVGLDKNPNGLRGNTLDLIIIDECGFVGNLDYVYKSVIIPATTHRPNAKIILISTPPSTPAHPFLDYVQKAEAEGGYKMFTIFDNPMLDDATVLRLMKETGCKIPESDDALSVIATIRKSNVKTFPANWFISTTFKREYLCEFILEDDLALCKEFKDEFIQDIPKDEYYVYYHKLAGMDMGRKDHTALIFGYYDFKRAALIIEDELTMYGPEWTTETLKTEIKKKEKDLWTEDMKAFRRIADTNNQGLLTDLSTLHNIYFMPVKKDASLEQMVNRVREWVNQGRIIINPRCKMLIGNLKYGVWNEKRTEFSRSKTYGHFDHFAALMYLLIHTPVSTNPIPATHGHVNHKSWLGNVDKTGSSRNAQTIRQLFGPKRSK